jgi:hypothetical protein
MTPRARTSPISGGRRSPSPRSRARSRARRKAQVQLGFSLTPTRLLLATCSIEWTSAEARVAAVCVLRAISQGGRALLLDRSRDRAGTGREFIDGARDGGYLVD